MSQATLDDDELFDEAASEMREDVEASLDSARAALPAAEAIWDVEADNTLGVLNALKGSLDTGDAAADLHDAKKWLTMGTKADAFSDADDLEDDVAELEATLEQIEDAHDQVAELTATVPELRGALEDAHAAAEATDDDSSTDDGAAADGGSDVEADADEAEAEA